MRYKYAQVIDPNLEAEYLRSILSERPILSRVLGYGFPAIGAGIISNLLLRKIFRPEIALAAGAAIPMFALAGALGAGLHRKFEIERLATDPFYRKMVLLREMQRASPLMGAVENMALPARLLLWKRLFG